MEYSVAKNAAFWFWCFLFKPVFTGDEAFTTNGFGPFSNWKKAIDKFRDHVSSSSSAHNKARTNFENFQNKKQSVAYIVKGTNLKSEQAYCIRLTAILDVIRYLLGSSLAFRGHDESSTSLRKGNFLELVHWYSLRNEEVGNVVLKNAPGNNQMTAPLIQKDMINACAVETTLAMLGDLGDKSFSIMVDEAHDCSVKEHMAVVIRYVNKRGEIFERFLGLVHVRETSAKCLKEAIESLFAKYGLSLSRLRGQGYDSAANMQGGFNGLKSLILRENPYAWYVHCFAHQLQLVIVAVCKTNRYTCDLFVTLAMIVNTCGSSCKRSDELRQKEHERRVERLENGEITSGTGKNQDTSLHRPGDTRWGSHYVTVVRLIDMWPSVLEVLQIVFDDNTQLESGAQVRGLYQRMQTFEFVFPMILMKRLLGMTNRLSMVLQEKDANILNAIIQIKAVKIELQSLRESGWDGLLNEEETFCQANKISIVNMEDIVPRLVRMKRDGQTVINYHHYRVEIFCEVYPKNYDFIYFFLNKVVSIFNLITIIFC